ncbi:hypothetical protein LSUE1_G000372 [Lachnellula suecica]|uniref:EthD domain-containing protein n=1 Tax=Lachnellula suecica TaxID=602035 RepID=A0A8T9CSI3_9HELO|nr:hypothetical protein LSUE1_G000372 [Lachnellula suecica]
MPYSILIIAHRKPGTSPAEFKQHYENVHIPLLKELSGSLFPITHERRYLQRTEGASHDAASNPATVLVGTQGQFEYDSYAQLTWEDAEAFQKFFAVISQPEAAARITADEEMFLIREKTGIVVSGDAIVSKR